MDCNDHLHIRGEYLPQYFSGSKNTVKEKRNMLSYDENGNLRDYEEDQQKVVCGKCHKTYLQETEEQVAGFREVDDDNG